MNTIDPLQKLRTIINSIDKKIIDLIKKRELISIEIAKIKQENQKPVKDINREKQLLDNVITLAKERKLNDQMILNIFKIIVKHSVLIQELFLKKNNRYNCNKLFYLGPEGSYSHIAAIKYTTIYLKNYMMYACTTFIDVINKTESNPNSYAILPIENTCSGSIHEIYDILQNTNLFIIDKINIKINHCLLGLKNSKIEDITTIYTHQQPLIQSNKFIQLYPHWKIKYTNSSSDAMQSILNHQNIKYAALGNEKSGKVYCLQILKKNINNQINNKTCFIILNNKLNIIKEQNNVRTKLILYVKPYSNYINNIKLIFTKLKLKIIKLISRPNINDPSLKVIYITVLANLYLETHKNILNNLNNIAVKIKILGCYINK
ncbi:Bifunctional chorismate mutase/prephenate dehydratase [Buchnera aphidicola (Eriosoma lanigerum)]|uniref:prephenate dehydratase domain-containing protein n=1 Tax=Buchnera aphidicola TaxID=9 RepID=UPI003464419C